MHKHGIFLSKRQRAQKREVSRAWCCTVQHHRNYTLIAIIQLLLCLRARARAHILCILYNFIIAICTTAKWNKTHTRACESRQTLYGAFHCAVHTRLLIAPIPFHFWVAGVLNCSGKLTLCQRCKISFCRQSGRATIRPEQHIICLSLFYCYAIGMRVASRQKKRQNHMCAFTFQSSHRVCTVFHY